MSKLYKELRPFIVAACAAWVLGFFGILGAHQGAKLIGVALVIAYEESAAEENVSDE